MKIALLGTRGIPNEYGGFEQFADVLSQGLVQKGHEVTVYCSKNHSYTEQIYNGVSLVHCKDPENRVGTAGQFIYDLNCMLHARKQNYNIIYVLGYTSSSIWQWLIQNKAIVVTNMDGLEWKRSKYSTKVQKFLKYAEKLAVKLSDFLVADSIGIQTYLKNEYGVDSAYHPYGSFVHEFPDNSCLVSYTLEEYNYDILIARFEPENNIEMVLEAFSKSQTKRKFILIGNYAHTEFGKQMFAKYSNDKRIQFLGAIYNQDELQNLRHFSNIYFHGHSVGGTNPSLLEAMGSSSLIAYHDNDFNRAIVGDDGLPFLTISELTEIINTTDKKNYIYTIEKNIHKIKTIYSWDIIIENYEQYFTTIVNMSNSMSNSKSNSKSVFL